MSKGSGTMNLTDDDIIRALDMGKIVPYEREMIDNLRNFCY